MKNTNMSKLIDLECNAGCTLNNFRDMEGATMLFDDLISELLDHPEAAASYVAEGIITKKLLAINAVLKNAISDSQKEITSAHKIIQELVASDRGAEDESK